MMNASFSSWSAFERHHFPYMYLVSVASFGTIATLSCAKLRIA